MQIQALKEQNNYTSKETKIFILHFIAKAFLMSLFFLIILLLVFSLVIVGDVLYNVKKGNNVVPLFAGYIIVTPSMVPTIKINDAVVVKRFKYW